MTGNASFAAGQKLAGQTTKQKENMNTYFFLFVFNKKTAKSKPDYTFGPYIHFKDAVALLDRVPDLISFQEAYTIHINEMLFEQDAWDTLGTRMEMTVEKNKITTGKL